MALAPFRRERAVKEILLVKALPLRVVLLYRTAGWNARLFRKSLCKRLCKSLKSRSSAEGRPFRRSGGAPWFLPSAEGERFRRSGGLPPQARQALPSRGIFAMTWRGIAADRRRGYAVPTAKGKRGQGHQMVPLPPLDSPKPSFAPRRPSVARRNGGYGGSVPCVGQLLGGLLCPEFPLRYPPRITVRGQTVQGDGVLLRKALLRSSAVPWSSKRPCGSLVFRRATEGSRVLRKVWGVKRGKKTLVVFPLLPPAVGTAFLGPPKAAIAHAHFERQVASTGCAAVSAEGLPSAEGKSSLLFLS